MTSNMLVRNKERAREKKKSKSTSKREDQAAGIFSKRAKSVRRFRGRSRRGSTIIISFSFGFPTRSLSVHLYLSSLLYSSLDFHYRLCFKFVSVSKLLITITITITMEISFITSRRFIEVFYFIIFLTIVRLHAFLV